MLERLKNPGTLISITSAILILVSNFGIEIDNEKIILSIKAICTIGIMLGVLNNPTTDGLDLPFYHEAKEKYN